MSRVEIFIKIIILFIVYSGCNDPRNVNRLPTELNARIPDSTLNQLLVGQVDSTCYRCDTCFDENAPSINMSACTVEYCTSSSCSFVATHGSITSIAQCGNSWFFTSGCISSLETAEVDMTLMYYLRSQNTVLYQMKAICHNNYCNSFSTFIQLKNAITIYPDLTCLINETSSSTTSSSTIPTGSTTSASTVSTTTSTSPVDYILMNNKLFIIIIFFLIYI